MGERLRVFLANATIFKAAVSNSFWVGGEAVGCVSLSKL
jgi:hypothetical protein